MCTIALDLIASENQDQGLPLEAGVPNRGSTDS